MDSSGRETRFDEAASPDAPAGPQQAAPVGTALGLAAGDAADDRTKSRGRRRSGSAVTGSAGLDTVDGCRIRLLALRTRIETNWPEPGGALFRRGRGLSREATEDIASLLIALPTPLPLHAGAAPEAICREGDADMREVAGRAVDAGLALLDGATLETVYEGHVKMLEDYSPGADESIIVSDFTVGVLVATIIGTLEAVAETLLKDSGGEASNKARRREEAQPVAPPHRSHSKRGPGVPRI